MLSVIEGLVSPVGRRFIDATSAWMSMWGVVALIIAATKFLSVVPVKNAVFLLFLSADI